MKTQINQCKRVSFLPWLYNDSFGHFLLLFLFRIYNYMTFPQKKRCGWRGPEGVGRRVLKEFITCYEVDQNREENYEKKKERNLTEENAPMTNTSKVNHQKIEKGRWNSTTVDSIRSIHWYTSKNFLLNKCLQDRRLFFLLVLRDPFLSFSFSHFLNFVWWSLHAIWAIMATIDRSYFR